MKLSEIHYSNKFDDLDSQLKNFINQEKHVIFIDSKLSSIINLDPKFKIFVVELLEKLVAQTDNDLDDKALAIVKKGLGV